MAITNFIPEIWNAEMQLAFTESTIAAGLVNRSYEGDLRNGNTVHITTGTAIAIKDYKAGVVSDGASGTLPRTTAADAVASTQIDLLVDQEKSFDFYVDDIDRAQVAGSLEAFTQSAGTGLAEDADKFILATAVTGAGSTVTPAAAITTGDAALNVLRDLRKVLNKAHVPQGSRVAIVNAEFEALLLDAGSKLMAVNTSGSPAGLRDAAVGNLLGFDIYTSENLPNVTQAQALAFYRPAMAYVSQIQGTEALRSQDKFADRLRGLHVYGGKVVRSAGVAVWTNHV